jgi:hypothetical protein
LFYYSHFYLTINWRHLVVYRCFQYHQGRMVFIIICFYGDVLGLIKVQLK